MDGTALYADPYRVVVGGDAMKNKLRQSRAGIVGREAKECFVQRRRNGWQPQVRLCADGHRHRRRERIVVRLRSMRRDVGLRVERGHGEGAYDV